MKSRSNVVIGISYNDGVGGATGRCMINYIQNCDAVFEVRKIDYIKSIQETLRGDTEDRDKNKWQDSTGFTALINMIKDDKKGIDWRDSETFKKMKKSTSDKLRDICGLIIPGNSYEVSEHLYNRKGVLADPLQKTLVDDNIVKNRFYNVVARNVAEAALVAVAEEMGIPILGICGGTRL